MIRNILLFVLATTLLLLAGCGPSTKLTGYWKEAKETPLDFKHMAVIGIFKDLDARKLLESNLEDMLDAKGINAESGLTFLPPTAVKGSMSLDIVDGFLTSNNFDAVLLVSVLRVDDEKRYVPAATYGYYPWSTAGFNNYYGQMTNYLYTPGYTYEETNIFLEANIYRYPSGELVYSSQTQSMGVYDLKKTAYEVSYVLSQNLEKENVLTTKNNK